MVQQQDQQPLLWIERLLSNIRDRTRELSTARGRVDSGDAREDWDRVYIRELNQIVDRIQRDYRLKRLVVRPSGNATDLQIRADPERRYKRDGFNTALINYLRNHEFDPKPRLGYDGNVITAVLTLENTELTLFPYGFVLSSSNLPNQNRNEVDELIRHMYLGRAGQSTINLIHLPANPLSKLFSYLNPLRYFRK